MWSIEFEYAANAFSVASFFLAARNNIHTWWLGIAGYALLGMLFFLEQFYAASILMLFYIGTGLYGWHLWKMAGSTQPISYASNSELLNYGFLALLVVGAHAALLHYFFDAYMAHIDSAILGYNMLALFLLMQRKVQTWWFWLMVNTVAIPLYVSRELYLSAGVYVLLWLNAWYGWYQWRRKM